jgi:hypothetical protein
MADSTESITTIYDQRSVRSDPNYDWAIWRSLQLAAHARAAPTYVERCRLEEEAAAYWCIARTAGKAVQ